MYFVRDMRQQAKKTVQAIKDTDIDIIWKIYEMLNEKYRYAKSFKFPLEADPSPKLTVKINSEKILSGEHFRRYNTLAFNEGAIIKRNEET